MVYLGHESELEGPGSELQIILGGQEVGHGEVLVAHHGGLHRAAH